MKKSLVMIALALASTSENAVAQGLVFEGQNVLFCTVTSQTEPNVFSNNIIQKQIVADQSTNIAYSEDSASGTRLFFVSRMEHDPSLFSLSVVTLNGKESSVEGVAMGDPNRGLSLILPGINRAISCAKIK